MDGSRGTLCKWESGVTSGFPACTTGWGAEEAGLGREAAEVGSVHLSAGGSGSPPGGRLPDGWPDGPKQEGGAAVDGNLRVTGCVGVLPELGQELQEVRNGVG